jgi:hypothetical protein
MRAYRKRKGEIKQRSLKAGVKTIRNTDPAAGFFLDDPPKLAGRCNRHLPRSHSEILSADRSILCNDLWLTSWLIVDRDEVRTRLGDNYVVAIHYNS